MGLFIGVLEFILVVDCLFLILLILVQLPKKEAGVGAAFGGGATDALFGAGSGNVLTKLTKYTAGIFLGLALVLSVMMVNQRNAPKTNIEQELKRKANGGALPPAAAKFSTTNATPAAGASNNAITLNLTNATKAAAPTNATAK
ncbi:MAG: preprotein translocase subunit SecG [Verrucomicrobia bacterium]|nr:preprotein translocase subunit SecG [Verrucomicrobiota bacterium]